MYMYRMLQVRVGEVYPISEPLPGEDQIPDITANQVCGKIDKIPKAPFVGLICGADEGSNIYGGAGEFFPLGTPLLGRYVSLQKKVEGQFDINEIEVRADDSGKKISNNFED